MLPTWSQGLQGWSVVFLHPLVSIIQQQAYSCRCSIKLIYFQPLYHFPVTACKITNISTLTFHHSSSTWSLTVKAEAEVTVSTEQKQWQDFIYFFQHCMFLNFIHICFKEIELLPPLSRQVTPDKFLTSFCLVTLPRLANCLPVTSLPGSGYTGVLSNSTVVPPLQSGPYTT